MQQILDNPDSVQPLFNQLKTNFQSQKTKQLSFRKKQLENLIRGHLEMKNNLDEALKKDLGYSPFLASFLSHSVTHNQLEHTLNHFQEWAREKFIQTPVAMGVANTYTKSQPLGVILVLSAWNYPIYTALPFVAVSIAAGNCVLLKPSQLAPSTSHVLKELFDKYLDPKFYRVLQGKVQVAKKLVSLPFDSILFTGSTVTGRYVAQSAAKNLTPCVLQLGGKCPVIVDQSANLQSAAMRILFGKYTNCGQTCVGADHVFAHKNIKKQLIEKLIDKVQKFYGKQKQSQTADMGKIINIQHVERLQNLLKQNHGGKVIYGGKVYRQNQFIQPTIVDQPRQDSKMMNEQIFGPILPILQYDNLDNLIKLINSKPKPLVIYLFSESNHTKQKVKNLTSSGAFVTNDVVLQMLNSNLPFGGVGKSGYGRYHGKLGFDACSNLKSIMQSKCLDIYPLTTRYPPYTDSTQKTITFLLKVGKMNYSDLYRRLAYLVLIGLGAGGILYFKPKL